MPTWEMARIFWGIDAAAGQAEVGRDENPILYIDLCKLRIKAMSQLSRLLPWRSYSLFQLRDVCVTSATKEGLDKLRENDEWKDRPILLGKMQGKPYELLDGNHRLYLWHEIGGNVRVPAVVIPGDFRL